MHLPPLPDLPPFLAGRSVVVIDGAYAGSFEAGAAAVEALRALEPEMDTWAATSPAVLSHIHMDPEEPIPYLSEGMLLRELDEAGLEAFAAAIQPGAPVLFGELRHLGGAVGRVPGGAGAIGRLDGEYMMFGVGIVMGPETAAPIERALAAFKRVARRVRHRLGVPQLRRAAGRRGHVLHRRGVRAAARDPRRGRPGRADGRQPPDPRRT